MKLTFALGFKADPKAVTSWCEPLGAPKDGVQKFWCLNGAWNGTFNQEKGEVRVDGDDNYVAINVVEVWAGYVPREHAGHYNDAIAWIITQL